MSFVAGRGHGWGRNFGVSAAVVLGTAAGLGVVGDATAVDWDGNFAVDGNNDGAYSDGVNWVGNVTPGAGNTATFNIADRYTVELDTAGIQAIVTSIRDGEVFVSGLGNGATQWRPGTVNISGVNTQGLWQKLDFDLVGAGESISVVDGATLGMNDVTGQLRGLNANDSTTPSVRVVLEGTDLTFVPIPGASGSGAISISGTDADGGALLEVSSNSTIDATRAAFGVNPNTLGTAIIEGGSELSAQTFLVGFTNGRGEVTVRGSGSLLTVTPGSAGDALFIGSSSSTGTGSGVVTIETGGTVDVNSVLSAGFGSLVDIQGGSLEVADSAFISGELRQSSTTGSSSTFDGFTSFTETATFNLGGGTVTFNDVTVFDADTTYTHTGGTVVFNAATTVNPISLGFGADTATSATAAWTINDNVNFARRLRAGEDADTRSNINVGAGGVLRNTQENTQADLAVGFNGRGDLAIFDDGLVDIYDDVIFGQNAGGRGNATLTGDGELRVNRNGSGSNMFIGFSGTGSVTMSGNSTLTVGNDLLIQTLDTADLGNSFLGFTAPGVGGSTPDTSVTVGNDLLIGTTTVGGTLGGLLINGQGTVDVANLTRVRASGQFDLAGAAVVTTHDFTTDVGAVVNLRAGELKVVGGLGTINHGTLVVGAGPGTGFGRSEFTVSDGATVNLAAGLSVGELDGDGIVTVTGINTQISHNNTNTDTRIGNGGMGQLDIGSLAEAELGDLLVVGDGANGDGLINVFGAQAGQPSILRVNGGGASSRIDIGLNGGTGEIIVSGGGYLETLGVINVGNGSDNPNTSRILNVTGQGDGLGSQLFARQVNVQNNQAKLIISGANARVDIAESLNLSNSGDWIQSGGILTVPTINRESGFTTINGGTIRTGQFNGDFTNDKGTLTPDSGVAAGSRFDDLDITGEYTQGDDATLLVQLGGTTAGTTHDRLIVDVVTLEAGTGLAVELLDGFMPTLGDSFEILLANGVFGTFGETSGLNLADGLELQVAYALDRITLNVVEAALLAGDYNGNGTVDAADYTVWQDNFGSMTILAADGNGNGVVDAADYTVWQDNFGASAAAQLGLNNIPEPGTLAVVLVGLPALLRRRAVA